MISAFVPSSTVPHSRRGNTSGPAICAAGDWTAHWPLTATTPTVTMRTLQDLLNNYECKWLAKDSLCLSDGETESRFVLRVSTGQLRSSFVSIALERWEQDYDTLRHVGDSPTWHMNYGPPPLGLGTLSFEDIVFFDLIRTLAVHQVHGEAAQDVLYTVFFGVLRKSLPIREWVEKHSPNYYAGVKNILPDQE